MNLSFTTFFVTHDPGLLRHWQQAHGSGPYVHISQIEKLFEMLIEQPCLVWVDTSIPQRPIWSSDAWRCMVQNDMVRIIAASSNPSDSDAMDALDIGCVGYCHAYADATTLHKVREVIEAGQVWIGKSLMSRLLNNVKRLAKEPFSESVHWRGTLTSREVEIALLAAKGASNAAIAGQCNISERTVKAHLSAVFDKLNIADRLQLALRVHGIQ